MQLEGPRRRAIDGLTNPKVYHRPPPVKRPSFWRRRRVAILAIIGLILSFFIYPQVPSLARQFEIFSLLNDGRYLVLFQNDAEIRASGGFIGSFAIVEANHRVIKPLYFETNIYKLDDPFTKLTRINPSKPLQVAIGDRGWGLRDANFAADWRDSAQSVIWFFEQETKQLTGPKKAAIDQALGGNYQVDGVVAVNMSAFIDLLKDTGPIIIPNQNITVNTDSFFPLVQEIVERDYFKDPAQKELNEPKTILQNLFPLALQAAQNLPKTTQYRLAKQLFDTKKVIIYARDTSIEQTLVDQGWAGALEVASDLRPDKAHDFLAIVRSSHGGNKSSLDINPVYRYQLTPQGDTVKAELAITFEHTGQAEWPSGPNHEYLRVLAPIEATIVTASRNGQDATAEIDIGTEAGRRAFGFWLHTSPQSSQTLTLRYQLPRSEVESSSLFGPDQYHLVIVRQPGAQAPDLTVIYNGKQLFQGRLNSDRQLSES